MLLLLLLLLLCWGEGKGMESTHAKRHAEKPESPRPLSRVGSGLVWLGRPSANPPPQSEKG